MQLVIGSTYESSRGFGRLLYLGETHGIDGYLPTFRTTKGEFKHYSYDQLPGALVEFASPTVSRADELIACLEGEIAKRDEELAACRVAVENCELFRARIVELESRYQRDVWGLNNEGDPIGGEPAGGYANDNARLRAELAALKAQGVVMPEPMKRGDEGGSGEYGAAMIRGYNACLREVARLNAAPAAPAADSGLVDALEMALEIGDGCSRGFLGKFQAKAREALAANRAKGVV